MPHSPFLFSNLIPVSRLLLDDCPPRLAAKPSSAAAPYVAVDARNPWISRLLVWHSPGCSLLSHSPPGWLRKLHLRVRRSSGLDCPAALPARQPGKLSMLPSRRFDRPRACSPSRERLCLMRWSSPEPRPPVWRPVVVVVLLVRPPVAPCFLRVKYSFDVAHGVVHCGPLRASELEILALVVVTVQSRRLGSLSKPLLPLASLLVARSLPSCPEASPPSP